MKLARIVSGIVTTRASPAVSLIAIVLTPNVIAVMRAATKVELLIRAIDLIVNKIVQARVTPKKVSADNVNISFILVIPFFTVITL